MGILTNCFGDLMNHIKEYAGKKKKLFLNVSPLTTVNLLLWPFKVSSLYLADLHNNPDELLNQRSLYPANLGRNWEDFAGCSTQMANKPVQTI